MEAFVEQMQPPSPSIQRKGLPDAAEVCERPHVVDYLNFIPKTGCSSGRNRPDYLGGKKNKTKQNFKESCHFLVKFLISPRKF